MKNILYFIILVLSSCCSKPKTEKIRMDYRIGNSFIRLSIDNLGNATAQSGSLIETSSNSFVLDSISDSTKFKVKVAGQFINRLKELHNPVVETGKGYSRTQLFLGDSLYYDTKMYSSDFWKLYSIISDEIPIEFNPFKTHRFD